MSGVKRTGAGAQGRGTCSAGEASRHWKERRKKSEGKREGGSEGYVPQGVTQAPVMASWPSDELGEHDTAGV